jgi:hypothetical protein
MPGIRVAITQKKCDRAANSRRRPRRSRARSRYGKIGIRRTAGGARQRRPLGTREIATAPASKPALKPAREFLSVIGETYSGVRGQAFAGAATATVGENRRPKQGFRSR